MASRLDLHRIEYDCGRRRPDRKLHSTFGAPPGSCNLGLVANTSDRPQQIGDFANQPRRTHKVSQSPLAHDLAVQRKEAEITRQRVESTPGCLWQIEPFVDISQELGERALSTKQLQVKRPGYRSLVAIPSSSGPRHQESRRMGGKEVGQRLLHNSPTQKPPTNHHGSLIVSRPLHPLRGATGIVDYVEQIASELSSQGRLHPSS
jgi:hypothetical protein